MLRGCFQAPGLVLNFELNLSSSINYTANKELQRMFAEIFQRQENEVKDYGLKTVNKVRASNFLAGRGGRISSYTSVLSLLLFAIDMDALTDHLNKDM